MATWMQVGHYDDRYIPRGSDEDIDRRQDRASVREGAMRGESLWEVRGREWGNKLVIRSGIQWLVGLHILIGTYILLLSRT